jgi:DNA sulfur modification protein DndD
MIFKELSCKNFIKFKDPQKLTFSSGKKHVTLIHGDGKAGKSTIYRALRWVLYGSTGDELEYKDNLQLINNINKKAGNFDMEVKLEFDLNDSTYIAQRNVRLKKGKKTCSQSADLDEFFYVVKDGEQEEDAEKTIKKILDEDISDFFIFDGEKLQDYKDLIYANAKNRSLLKEKIEKAMKLPHLVQATKDLGVIKKDLDKERDKEISDTELRQMTKKLSALSELIEDFEKEQENLEQEIRTLTITKGVLEEKREAYGDKNQKVYELNTLIGKTPELKKRVKLLEQNLKKSTKDSWLIISDLIRQKNHALFKDKNKEQMEEKLRIDGLKAELQKMQKGIKTGICPFCDANLTTEEKKSLKIKIKELKDEIESASPPDVVDQPPIVLVSEDIDSLKTLTQDLKLAKAEHLNAIVDKEDLERQVGEDSGDVGKLQDDISKIENKITELHHAYEEIERELQGGEDLKKKGGLYDDKGARDFYKRLNAQIDENRPDDALKDKADFIVNLQNTFQEIKEQMERQVKEDVELRANELYKAMTEKKKRNNTLKVSDSYGLKLIDPFDNEIPTSGTGNAIVAYSLLIALKEATSMKAPFVIDTPLGRISPNYKKLILEEIPNCTDQLILLVHDGELKRGTDLHNVIKQKEGKSMKLNYKDDFESTIERI